MMKNLLLFLASVAMSLILAEIVVRVLDISPPIGTINVGHYQLSEHPLLRFEYKRNASPRRTVPKGKYEGFVRANFWDTFHTNSWGFPDCEHTLKKPDNTIRIAVLGDSITAALSIDRSQRFTQVLEDYLNRNAEKKRFEIMNFGVGGYDMLQEVVTLEEKVLPFSPDMAIFAYCLNDGQAWADGGLYQILTQRLSSTQRRWIDTVYFDFYSPPLKILHSSRLYTFLKYLYVTRFKHNEDLAWKAGSSDDLLSDAFLMLSNFKKQHNLEIIIVIFPYFDQLSEYPYVELHQEVRNWAQQYHFDVLDLFDYYLAENEKDGREFRASENDICHPNELGHRIAGHAIGECLKQRYPEIMD